VNKHKIKGFVKLIKKLYPPPLKVIDIGAREGFTVHYMQKEGYDTEGIEIDRKWTGYKGRNVKYGNILEMETEPVYDMVVSRHCIEHCGDNFKFLKAVWSLLKPDGVFLMLFPLIQCMTYDYKVSCENPEECFLSEVLANGFKTISFGDSGKRGIHKLTADEYLYIGHKNG